jgi:nodulation protein E
MSKCRVVITGLGVMSGIGKNTAEFWDSIQNCRDGIAPMEMVDRSRFRFQNACEVKNYHPNDYFANTDLIDRFAQFGVITAREAVKDANLEWNEDSGEKTCIVFGTSIGGQDEQDRGLKEIYQQDRNRLHPLTIPRIMPNSAASNVSMEFGITGATFTVSTACASSNHAIGNAFWMIRNGLYDIGLAGGTETPFSLGFLKAWESIRVVSPDTCRPFSKNRNGMILGEGGGTLVLESLESAQKRGAKIYGEIIGFGMSADASHITKPSQIGAERAMKMALKDGGVSADKIDYINAHGTGTVANDSMETAAIRTVFGSHAENLAVSSTKSMHGHALGGVSSLEAVATVLGIHHGIIPPTANYTEFDPECDLDVVPNESREKRIDYAMSNAFAFGGLNAVLVFKRFE